MARGFDVAEHAPPLFGKDRHVAPRLLRLRYAGTCATCGCALPARTNAWWDSDLKAATCLACRSVSESEPADLPKPVHHAFGAFGNAGGSALTEYERRHRRREEAIEKRWGRFAGVAKFLSDDPQSTIAWAKGAVGEQRLAKYLVSAVGDRAVLLNDRAVKGTRGNVDHIVIASSGVWIIDAKNYAGLVEHRNVGGWFNPDFRLVVKGRDQTKLVHGLAWQIEAVRKALAGGDVPIYAALCFTDAEWRLFAKPIYHDGILVTWAKKLAELVAAPGPLSEDMIFEVADRLMTAMPDKSGR